MFISHTLLRDLPLINKDFIPFCDVVLAGSAKLEVVWDFYSS